MCHITEIFFKRKIKSFCWLLLLYHAKFCLFRWLFWWFYVTLENYSLIYIQTSPLLLKGFKNWTILGTRGHWALRVLYRAKLIVTLAILIYWPSSRTRDTRARTCCRKLGNGAFTTCFNDLGLIERLSPACEVNSLPPWQPHLRFSLMGRRRTIWLTYNSV